MLSQAKHQSKIIIFQKEKGNRESSKRKRKRGAIKKRKRKKEKENRKMKKKRKNEEETWKKEGRKSKKEKSTITFPKGCPSNGTLPPPKDRRRVQSLLFSNETERHIENRKRKC